MHSASIMENVSLVSSCKGLPTRVISNDAQLAEFKSSPSYMSLVNFIKDLGDASIGLKLSDVTYPMSLGGGAESATSHTPKGVAWCVELLDRMQGAINNHPAEPNSSRYGNPAFRNWLDVMRRIIPEVHRTNPSLPPEHTLEISSYLLNSLGDYQRIDYGTGHELHFVAWLYCLHRVGHFGGAPMAHLSLILFPAYLGLMRSLQRIYWLEPAGSHGVWGLDDYHFIPFLLGAAQLSSKAHCRPRPLPFLLTLNHLAHRADPCRS